MPAHQIALKRAPFKDAAHWMVVSLEQMAVAVPVPAADACIEQYLWGRLLAMRLGKNSEQGRGISRLIRGKVLRRDEGRATNAPEHTWKATENNRIRIDPGHLLIGRIQNEFRTDPERPFAFGGLGHVTLTATLADRTN